MTKTFLKFRKISLSYLNTKFKENNYKDIFFKINNKEFCITKISVLNKFTKKLF